MQCIRLGSGEADLTKVREYKSTSSRSLGLSQNWKIHLEMAQVKKKKSVQRGPMRDKIFAREFRGQESLCKEGALEKREI